MQCFTVHVSGIDLHKTGKILPEIQNGYIPLPGNIFDTDPLLDPGVYNAILQDFRQSAGIGNRFVICQSQGFGLINFPIIKSRVGIGTFQYGNRAITAFINTGILTGFHCQNPGYGRVFPVDLTFVVKGVAAAIPPLAQVNAQRVFPFLHQAGQVKGLYLELAMVIGIAGGEKDVADFLTVQFRLVYAQCGDDQSGFADCLHRKCLLEYIHGAFPEGAVCLDKTSSQFFVHRFPLCSLNCSLIKAALS